ARRRARGGRARDDAQRPPAVPAAGRRVSDADAVLDLAVRLARAAGRLQRERYETRFEVRVKGTPLDLVTEVDHACEKLIVEGIAAERPADAVEAEEGGGGGREGPPGRPGTRPA